MLITPAYAQTAGAAPTDGGFGAFISFAPLILLFGLFYLLFIRPQNKRMKEQQAAIAAVKKGDEVTTAGGIIGKATRVEDKIVEVEIANGVKIRVVKSTLASVSPHGSKPAND
ncbi:MAG: preprotein translocase subunit YajC [Sphingomonas sp.]|jgi:preprotein translocase subunit YajC